LIPQGTPVAKARPFEGIDAETRKLGERSRLETCVVLAVNACLLAVLFLASLAGLGMAKVTR
jgi:hypothetical protein